MMSEERSTKDRPIKDRSIDLKQDRRQWLKTSATVLGSALLPIPAVVPGLAKDAPAAETPKAGDAKLVGKFFTPAQYTLVDELAEVIIPQDSVSGGAKAAKVVVYIEQIMLGSLDDRRKADFHEGLRLVDLMSQHYSGGKSFVQCSADEKIGVVTILADHEFATELPEVRFFRDLRELTIQGYYTSKIGIHDDQDYKGNVMLAEFVGCDDPQPPSAT
jgi:hypothetical protein